MMLPGPMFQMSWVVRDLEAAMLRWVATTGAGPFFVNPHAVVDKGRYRGGPAGHDYTVALAQSGAMQIELIAQHDDIPSIYNEIGDPGPVGTFHHMACFVDDAEAEFARYAAMGAPLAFDGWFGTMRLGYVDTRARIGCMIDILEHDEACERIFDLIARASVGWEGHDPIRAFPT